MVTASGISFVRHDGEIRSIETAASYAIPPIHATRCQMVPFLPPHSLFDMLPRIAAKSALHTIVRSISQKCPIRSPLCHASHKAFSNNFAATQHELHSRFVGNQLMNPG
jgi:hypothetical protein